MGSDGDEDKIDLDFVVDGPVVRDKIPYWRAYYAQNKDRIRAYKKRWLADNRDHVNVLSRVNRRKNINQALIREARYRKNNPNKLRNTWIKHEYGITVAEWDCMIIQQSGCCDLCDRPFGNTKRLEPVVDHSHSANKVRALIHHKCNVGLGMFDDSAELCDMAAAYRRRYQ